MHMEFSIDEEMLHYNGERTEKVGAYTEKRLSYAKLSRSGAAPYPR